MRPALVVVVVLLALPAARAGAQPDGRDLYAAGTAAIAEGRFADAVEQFRRSYELSANPAALFNLGVALRGLGRHVEARDAFARLLAEHGEASEALRVDARQMRAEEEARVARLAVVAPSGCEHRLDGRPVRATAASAGGLSVDLDAGRYELVVSCPGYEPWRWEGELGGGEARSLTVELRPLPAADRSQVPDVGPRPEPVDGGERHRPAGGWVLVGTGAALAATGAALLGVAVADARAVENAELRSDWADVEDRFDRADRLRIVAPVLLGAGAAALAGGLAWRVGGDGRAEARVRLGPGTLSIAGRF